MVTLFVGIGSFAKSDELEPGSRSHLHAPWIVRDGAETASAIRLKRRPRSR
jgi:hypothetical protein